MERLHGPTLLQALGAEEVSLAGRGGHPGRPAHPAARHRRARGLGSRASPATWPLVPAGPVIVHLDIHPANVILSEAHGPALVDWSNARTGTAELDVALTALILAEVAVDAGGVYSQAARALLAAFLRASTSTCSSALDDAAALRSADPSLVPGERALVPAAAGLVRDLIAVATPSVLSAVAGQTTAAPVRAAGVRAIRPW